MHDSPLEADQSSTRPPSRRRSARLLFAAVVLFTVGPGCSGCERAFFQVLNLALALASIALAVLPFAALLVRRSLERSGQPDPRRVWLWALFGVSFMGTAALLAIVWFSISDARGDFAALIPTAQWSALWTLVPVGLTAITGAVAARRGKGGGVIATSCAAMYGALVAALLLTCERSVFAPVEWLRSPSDLPTPDAGGWGSLLVEVAASVGPDRYATDAVFAGAAGLGLLLCLIGALTSFLASRGDERASSLATFGAWVTATLGAGGLAAVAACAWFLEISADGVERSPWRLFPTLLTAEVCLAALATVATIVTFALAFGRESSPDRRWPRRAAAVVLTLGFLVSQAGLVHAVVVLGAGEMPRFAPFEDWIHEGHSATVTATLTPGTDLDWWLVEAADQPVTATDAGSSEVRQRASAPLLTLTSVAEVEVRRELGHPSLPLRVGNRWHFTVGGQGTRDVVIRRRRQVTFSEADLVVEITGTAEENGRRVFIARASQGGESAEHHLTAADGAVLLGGEALVLPEPGDESATFRWPFVDASCTGMSRAGPRAEIPGPCRCSVRYVTGSNILLQAVTLGVRSGRQRGTRVYTLYSTSRGAQDAEAAPLPPGSVAGADRASACPPTDAGACLALPLRSDARSRHVHAATDLLRAAGARVQQVGAMLYASGPAPALASAIGGSMSWELDQTAAICAGQRRCQPRLVLDDLPDAIERVALSARLEDSCPEPR